MTKGSEFTEEATNFCVELLNVWLKAEELDSNCRVVSSQHEGKLVLTILCTGRDDRERYFSFYFRHIDIESSAAHRQWLSDLCRSSFDLFLSQPYHHPKINEL